MVRFTHPTLVIERRWWLGLASVLAGAVLAYAQTQGPTFSLWDLDSPPSATAPKSSQSSVPTPTPEKSPADELDQQMYGPQIWRLPSVGSGSSDSSPAALQIPKIESIPTPSPEEKSPLSNVPASLSGVLSTGERLDAKSDANKIWDGSFDLGMDGSEGNSENFNLHVGFHAKRKTENNVLTLSLDYIRQTAQTIATTNRLYFDGRLERLLAQSRWSLFAHETVEYDEFQSFNVLDTSDAGVGYRAIKNDNTTLIGRFGRWFFARVRRARKRPVHPRSRLRAATRATNQQAAEVRRGGGIRGRRGRVPSLSTSHPSRLGHFAGPGKEPQSSHRCSGSLQ